MRRVLPHVAHQQLIYPHSLEMSLRLEKPLGHIRRRNKSLRVTSFQEIWIGMINVRFGREDSQQGNNN